MAEPPAGPPPGWNAPDEREPEPEPRTTFPPPPPNPQPGPNPGPPNAWEVLPGRQPPGWGAPPPPPPTGPQQAGWGPAAPPPPYGYGQPQWGGGPAQGPGQQWAAPARPGIIPLRPLAVGEILDGAFRAIRSNPRTMAGFSAIVIALLTLLATGPQALLLSTYANSPLSDPESAQNVEASDVADLVGAGALTVLVSILEFVVATTIVSALLIVAVDSAVRGVSLRPGQLWVRVRPRVFSVLGLAVLVPFVLPLFFMIALVPGLIAVFVPGGGTPVRVIGVILLILGGLAGTVIDVALYLGFWAVAAPALLLENLGVFAALTRSYRLVRGSFWRVLGIGLLTALITGIMRQVFTVPFALIGAVLGLTQNDGGFGAALIQILVGDIGTILAGAVLYPFTAGVSALLYLDLRMRREGLDVDLIRQ